MHGFYQFGPDLFYDYYGVNGFAELQAYLSSESRWDWSGRKWDFWEWNPKRPLVEFIAKQPVFLYFRAEKTRESTVDQIPVQGQYGKRVPWGIESGARGDGWQSYSTVSNRLLFRIKDALPLWLRAWIKRAMRRDLTVKPWGLKHLGRY